MITAIRKLFYIYRTREDGTAAIEFSLMAMPFIICAVGILELSLMFTGGSLLEGSLSDASRLIKTGQLQQNGGTEQTFRDALCANVSTLIRCNEILFEVIPVGSGSYFDIGALPPVFDEDTGEFMPRGFDAGGVNDVMLVRAVYEYPLMTPLIGQLMTGGTGTYVMMSTIVFQTEPYEFEVP